MVPLGGFLSLYLLFWHFLVFASVCQRCPCAGRRGTTKSETPEANLKNIRRDFPEFMDKRLGEVTWPMLKKMDRKADRGGQPSLWYQPRARFDWRAVLARR